MASARSLIESEILTEGGYAIFDPYTQEVYFAPNKKLLNNYIKNPARKHIDFIVTEIKPNEDIHETILGHLGFNCITDIDGIAVSPEEEEMIYSYPDDIDEFVLPLKTLHNCVSYLKLDKSIRELFIDITIRMIEFLRKAECEIYPNNSCDDFTYFNKRALINYYIEYLNSDDMREQKHDNITYIKRFRYFDKDRKEG